MKKVIFEVVKRVVIAICLIYAFDMLVTSLKIFIPINFITIGVVSILGMSGLLALVSIFFVLS